MKRFRLTTLLGLAALVLGLGALVANAADPNAFNRLLPSASKRNPAPPDDGIHDPANEGTHMLQPPKEALSQFVKGISGNYVDWVKSLDTKKVQPRYDRLDPNAEPVVMDLNIVRQVKGSMPDVVYPHKQHTEWLDCSNCHPAIFVPQKGANQISMAAILLGEKCGVCHGKVAFPVSECTRCHSQPKQAVAAAPAAATPAAAAPEAPAAPPAATPASPPARAPAKAGAQGGSKK